MTPISAQFSAPEFLTWRRTEKWPANVTNTKKNIVTTVAVNMNIITNMNIVMMNIVPAMMTTVPATSITVTVTKAAHAKAEKTAMI